jgi:hypothetical protein
MSASGRIATLADATISGQPLTRRDRADHHERPPLRQIDNDLNIGQLADYIAMTGLAEIREDAKPGPAPTILHLFGKTQTARPTGLSSWDQAFLKALYTTKQASMMQLDEIKLRLDQQLVPQDSQR